MRFYEIVERDEAGGIKPLAPDKRQDPERYQTRKPRPKKRSRWQTPPETSVDSATSKPSIPPVG